MNAKKCDRCGVYYTETKKNALTEAIEAIAEVAKMMQTTEEQKELFEEMNFNCDLCPECKESLREWVKDGRRKESAE